MRQRIVLCLDCSVENNEDGYKNLFIHLYTNSSRRFKLQWIMMVGEMITVMVISMTLDFFFSLKTLKPKPYFLHNLFSFSCFKMLMTMMIERRLSEWLLLANFQHSIHSLPIVVFFIFFLFLFFCISNFSYLTCLILSLYLQEENLQSCPFFFSFRSDSLLFIS